MTTALARSGLSARVLTEDDGKGTAAQVLEIQSRHPLPFAGNPEGVFSWRIGRTTTSLVRTGFLPVADPDVGETGAEPDQGATAGPVAQSEGPAALGRRDRGVRSRSGPGAGGADGRGGGRRPL